MKKTVWYAGGGGIVRMGPFKSEVDAWAALRLTPEEIGRQGRIHPLGAYVWVEDRVVERAKAGHRTV